MRKARSFVHRESGVASVLAMASLVSVAACSSTGPSTGASSGSDGGSDGHANSEVDAMTASDAMAASTADGAASDASGTHESDASGTSTADASSGASADASSEGGGIEASSGSCPLGGSAPTSAPGPVKYVFVIALENHDAGEIVGNMANAPYINGTLLPCFASASNFNDPLPIPIPSEPHYVYMEAGTNALADFTFTTDADPGPTNSTSSTLHLATQLTAAAVTWRSYQEDYDTSTTGACPIHSSGFYAAKHNPFVFFQDVSGSPPSASATVCSQHHKAFTSLAGDLAAGGTAVAQYSFITPNLCNDMHGAIGCPNGNTIQAGDQWLSKNVPDILAFANANDGVIFLVWDEGDQTQKIPFLAIGPSVKRNYVGAVSYTHGSLVATSERIFGVSRLSAVASVSDFADLFLPGALP